MTNHLGVNESTSLEKSVIPNQNGSDIVFAKVTRTFSDKAEPFKVRGKLVWTSLCDSCYLQEMSEGDLLPVVTKPKSEQQCFYIFGKNGEEIYWGQATYYMAQKVSNRERTLFGRLRNRVYLALRSL